MKINTTKALISNIIILLTLTFGSFGMSSANAETADELARTLQNEIQQEEDKMPSSTELFIQTKVDWEITTIKIPYPRCTKHYEKISFDIPEFKWDITEVLGIKMHLPKIYNKRVDIKFDMLRCSKSYKIVKLHLPQFSDDAKGKLNVRTSNIESIVAKYQPKIKAAAIAEAGKAISLERKKIVANFSADIRAVHKEISKAKSEVQKNILVAQLKMITEMQDIVLKDLESRLKELS